MSGPVSLRLCCLAAMAPALTEATGHSRLELNGSSSPVCNNNSTDETAGVKLKGIVNVTAIASDSIASIKRKDPISNLVPRHRGFLQPIHQGNGKQPKPIPSELKPDHATDSLTEFQIFKSLPVILKQLSSGNKHIDYNSDHQYPKYCEKKMNQPSNGNGLNGTGKHFVKHRILSEDKKLNGHAKPGIAELSISNTLNFVTPGSEYVNKRNLGHVDSSGNPKEMCHTSDRPAKLGTKTVISNPVSQSYPSSCAISKQHVSTRGLDSTPGKPGSVSCPEPGPADLIKDATRKEFLLERRSQFLMRRLRRIQGKQLETGVHDQLKSFAEFQHQNLQTVASRAIRPFGDLQSTLFNSSDVKNLSTSNLVSLVRKLQSSQQKVAALNPKKYEAEMKGVLIMEQGVSAESERKSCQMKTNVGHWNTVVDADATESSSGGESCEEWEDCPVMEDKKMPVPLYKRAEWKWAVDRAALISRWTWLQAQVSDLEYRIRQQKEIYKTIRTSKGIVTLGNMSSYIGKVVDNNSRQKQQESPANVTTLMINVSNQASKLSQSLGNCLSPVPQQGPVGDKTKDRSSSKCLNGYLDGSHKTSTPQLQGMSRITAGIPSVGPTGDSASVTCSPDLNQPLDVSCVSARCRPVRFYRKRKLLRTAGLHQVNHKAARLSTVKCRCFPPSEYCPLCGGRYNNLQKLDAEGMAVMEKVALLDQAYHPVLSFPQEIALPIHFEALLKSGEWQTAKPPPKATLRAIAAEKRRQKLLNAQLKDQARKNRKKLTKSAAAILLTSAKLRSKYEGKSPHHSPKKKIIAENRLRRKEMKRRRAAQLAAAAQRKNGFGAYQDYDLDSLSSQTPSPLGRENFLSLSGQSASLKEAKELSMKRKRFENAYDINNIVIPYSMAAATRVEKLQYKEIQTPKWRELTTENSDDKVTEGQEPNTSEVEDASDEAFSARHFNLEEEERKRFRSYVTYPVRRGRHSRESESQSMDSHPVDPLMTEYNIDMDGHHTVMQYSASAFGREEGRRRSGSTSHRMSSQEDCLMDFEINRIVYEPWGKREFPLSENCYEDMQKEQVNARSARRTNYSRARVVKVHDNEGMEFVNPERSESPTVPASPSQSCSSGSTLEDLNDPEWYSAKRKDRRPSGNLRR